LSYRVGAVVGLVMQTVAEVVALAGITLSPALTCKPAHTRLPLVPAVQITHKEVRLSSAQLLRPPVEVAAKSSLVQHLTLVALAAAVVSMQRDHPATPLMASLAATQRETTRRVLVEVPLVLV
jgi:hypothetical protein